MKPNKLYAITIICLMCIAVCVAVFCAIASIVYGFNLFLFLFGVVGTIILARMAIVAFEDAFTVIGEDGVGQLRLFGDRRIFVRSILPWSEVRTFSMTSSTCYLRGQGFEVRVRLTLLDSDVVVEFLKNDLFIGESIDPELRPDRMNLVSKWIFALSALIAGCWLIANDVLLSRYLNNRVCGVLAILASLLWSIHIAESGSVLLDARGVEQRRIFYRGKFLARHRLTWENVTEFKSGRSSCRFSGRNVCVSVNSNYFSDPGKVVLFANSHIPHLVR